MPLLRWEKREWMGLRSFVFRDFRTVTLSGFIMGSKLRSSRSLSVLELWLCVVSIMEGGRWENSVSVVIRLVVDRKDEKMEPLSILGR